MSQNNWSPKKPDITMQPTKMKRPGFIVQHKIFTSVVVVVAILTAIGTINQSATKTATKTTPNTSTAPPRATAQPAPTGATFGQSAKASREATATTKAANASVLANEQTDFKQFYGQLAGLDKACTNANTQAGKALSYASQGASMMLQAYNFANTAHDICDTVVTDISELSIPDSLSDFKKLPDVLNYSTDHAGAIRDAWYDIAHALNDGNASLSTQATLQKHVQEAQASLLVEVGDLYVVGKKLHLDVATIPIITPN